MDKRDIYFILFYCEKKYYPIRTKEGKDQKFG
jgi:hypothetical protein